MRRSKWTNAGFMLLKRLRGWKILGTETPHRVKGEVVKLERPAALWHYLHHGSSPIWSIWYLLQLDVALRHDISPQAARNVMSSSWHGLHETMLMWSIVKLVPQFKANSQSIWLQFDAIHEKGYPAEVRCLDVKAMLINWAMLAHRSALQQHWIWCKVIMYGRHSW